MATLNEQIALIDLKLPDNAEGLISPADLRTVLYAMAASNTGGSALSHIVDTAGTTVTNELLDNRTVVGVATSGGFKNTGFTKATSSDTLVFTDGTTVEIGDVLTFFLA